MKRYTFRRFYRPIDTTVTELWPSGALLLTTIHGGKYWKHTFYGYTERQARRMFRQIVLGALCE